MFKKFNNFIDQAVTDMDERFGAFNVHPLQCFRIFDFCSAVWPVDMYKDSESFQLFGNRDIQKIIDHPRFQARSNTDILETVIHVR